MLEISILTGLGLWLFFALRAWVRGKVKCGGCGGSCPGCNGGDCCGGECSKCRK